MPRQKAVPAAPSLIEHVTIGPVAADDLAHVTKLDARITGTAKPDYWNRLFEAARADPRTQVFLVARREARLIGFIVGEIRAWEFGSAPCGWIFAIAVEPDIRLKSIGSGLFEAVCSRFRDAGVTRVRTMIARESQLILSFFRSQGMMAGPFVELEKDLDE
ncbi:GNAT family N-acetyltransferase [Blastochloris sulfoviridis]|uniref:GNAT family N-acetyltransferase n=1 Tax=Blastochloris sulfoviridis TaxID=50712 RepID=A0A5M6I5Y6_9HYPH|nr:GNAT family N-acetyltransferase [Blastochloris sulfoviridis]KAA5603543.1 GNAT family N-acetyltransferase [Blastochloris sulfoviridis]